MIKNSATFAATAIIKGLVSFMLIAAYTRLLSADAYGDYAIVIAVIGLADVFGFMWLRHTLMRHITDQQAKTDQAYFTNAVFVYGVISIIILVLIGALSAAGAIGGSEQGLIYELLGLLVLTEGISNLVILMARLRLKMGVFFALSIAKPLIALVAGIAFIYSGFGVAGAVWGLLISCGVASLVGLLKLPDFKALKSSALSKDALKSIAAFGLPLIAVLSIQSAVKATDRILLETIIGGDITGLYAAAQDIPYKLLTILISSIHLAAYPLAIKALDNGGREACRQQLKINAAALWGILLPAAIAISVLAPQLAHVFLGKEFRPFANDYFPVFAGVALLNCALQYYFVLSFNFAKKTQWLIIPFLIALSINAGIGVALIPQIGAQGAMLGSALAYIFLLLVSIVLGRKVFPLPLPAASLLKITAAAIIMGITLWSADLGLGLLSLGLYIALGGLTYVAALLALNPMGIRQYLLQRINR